MLQPSPLRGSGCNTLSHSGLANVNTRKRLFYPLIVVGIIAIYVGEMNTEELRKELMNLKSQIGMHLPIISCDLSTCDYSSLNTIVTHASQ